MSSALLSGRTAIVTGASSGIGRAIAETLGGAGAHVFLAGRTAAAMEESKKKIEEAGGRASIATVDVRDAAQPALSAMPSGAHRSDAAAARPCSRACRPRPQY